MIRRRFARKRVTCGVCGYRARASLHPCRFGAAGGPCHGSAACHYGNPCNARPVRAGGI